MTILNLTSDLQDLGLPEEESRTYLALLKLGRGYVSVIAKQAQVARVNCYHLLDNLVQKGLASVSAKDGKKMYQASNPESLVKQQVMRLRQAEKLLPALKQLGQEKTIQPNIRRVEGREGIRSIFEETLDSADEIIGYTNVDHLVQQLGDYLHYYAEERMRRKVRSRFMSPLGKQSKRFLSTPQTKSAKSRRLFILMRRNFHLKVKYIFTATA
jgi:sugar-specific transcriptional regulator TrmB